MRRCCFCGSNNHHGSLTRNALDYLGGIINNKMVSLGANLAVLRSRICMTLNTHYSKLYRTLYTSSDKEKQLIDRIIRVDHAGELGADRIYAGQLAVLGNTPVGPVIQHMWEQEKEHLETFEKLIPKYRVRPTALLPLWSIAGWVLGASTALLGKNSNSSTDPFWSLI